MADALGPTTVEAAPRFPEAQARRRKLPESFSADFQGPALPETNARGKRAKRPAAVAAEEDPGLPPDPVPKRPRAAGRGEFLEERVVTGHPFQLSEAAEEEGTAKGRGRGRGRGRARGRGRGAAIDVAELSPPRASPPRKRRAEIPVDHPGEILAKPTPAMDAEALPPVAARQPEPRFLSPRGLGAQLDCLLFNDDSQEPAAEQRRAEVPKHGQVDVPAASQGGAAPQVPPKPARVEPEARQPSPPRPAEAPQPPPTEACRGFEKAAKAVPVVEDAPIKVATPGKDVSKLAWDCDFKVAPSFELDLGKLDPLPFAGEELKKEDARPTVSFFDMLKDLD